MRTEGQTAKHKLNTILALLLIAALAIGGSLAYLSARTDKLENDFSFIDSDSNGDMQVDIDEPSWEDDADMVPGDEVPKDPVLINRSRKDIEEWVAVTVVIRKGQNGEGDKLTTTEAQLFDQYFDIDFGTNGESPGVEGHAAWTKLDISYAGAGASVYEGVYMYNRKVPADPGETGDGRNRTRPLFTRVIYSAEADGRTNGVIKNDWGGFSIILRGYAVQGRNVEWSTLPGIWENTID